jgi:tetratricopeptide (TPR) repeat protein
VFDNATGDHDSVAEYMPHGNRGNILFTSRNLSLARYVSHEGRIEVDSMEEEDAISLLLKSSLMDQCSLPLREAARSIAREPCCLPLAIDQAGAAIASGLCNIDDYLHRYSQHRQALLADPAFKGASNYGRAVYGTWDLSFNAINGMGNRAAESAIFILQTFAFFHHDHIMEEIIKRAAEAVEPSLDNNSDARRHICLPPPELLQLDQGGSWDPMYFWEGIRVLLSYSLVKKAAMSGIYLLHPLVHCWSRDSMSLEVQQTSSSSASILLSSSITFYYTTMDYMFRRNLVPHIKAIDQYTAELGIQKEYDDEQYTHFALAFHEAGSWNEEEKLEVQVMQMRNRVLGEEHPDTLSAMGNLAGTYSDQGHWKEAEELQVQVMQINKRILGEEHPDTLLAMGNLAMTYSHQGHWKEAEKLQVQVMQARKRMLGEEHPKTLLAMGNLAGTYSHQGHWKEAEELQVQVMQMRKRILGEEHPHTLLAMGNLAECYSYRGHWKEAEELWVQVLQMRKRILGEEHPHTLLAMGNLAMTYSHQGHWKKAEELQVQVMQMRKRVLGEEHPGTLLAMGNLAGTYSNQGHWKAAEELWVQVMQMTQRILGEEHPGTLLAIGILAESYSNQAHWKEAEELQVQVMQMRKRVLGEEHPATLLAMGNLARTYSDQGHWKEAEELQVQVMQIRMGILGEEHPDTLLAMGNLVGTYSDQGHWKEAEELQVQVMHQQNYNFLVAFSGLNALFRLPRKPTSPEDCLNLRTVKAGDSLFITHHFISIIKHV